jgi:hypothetical protein
MRTAVTFILATLLAPVMPGHAQEKKESVEPTVYKVEFTIRDGSDAAAKAGRRYTMFVDTNGKSAFQVGDKVPYTTGAFQPAIGTGTSLRVGTQYTYLDTGVNIDCWLKESNGKLALSANVDISAIVQPARSAATDIPNPTVASIRLSGARAVLTPGKPALVASIDDPVTMRKLDVEATVTKVN